MSLKCPSASIVLFLLEWLPKTLGWHLGPNGFLCNTVTVVGRVRSVQLPSRISSFMSLSSIFHDSFFSQQSGYTLNMLKFNMQR